MITYSSKSKHLLKARLFYSSPLEKENNIKIILSNIREYPDMINELDIWIDSEEIYIGHDYQKNKIEPKILYENSKNLILHIKGIELKSEKSLNLFNNILSNCHFFTHQEDDFVITNKGWIWSHPRNGFVKNTICVLPEKIESIDSAIKKNKFKSLKGICTDYPLKMLKLLLDC